MDSLDVQEITDTEDSLWKVIDHPFRYQSVLVGLITVPLEFSDRFCQRPAHPVHFDELGDDANKPSIVHDACYFYAWFPREIADKILLEAMGVIGMSWARRWAIYAGVRLGGWVAWNKHRTNGDGKILQ